MAESLSENTKAEFKVAFDTFDSNKDGFISSDDLQKLMNYLTFFPSKTEVTEMINEFTQGLNNQISFAQFLEIVSDKMFDNNAEKDLIQAFKLFDAQSRGSINALELQEDLLKLNTDLTEEELNAMLKDLKNDDGDIAYIKLVRDFLYA